MKSGGALSAKTIDIDRQHTPTARLCSPRAIRSRKERRLVSWTQTMHKSYFLAFFAYLGFQVANIIASSIDPQNLSPRINAGLSSWTLDGFQILKTKANSWMLNLLGHSWCMILLRRNLSLVYMVTEVHAYLFHLFCKFKQYVSK